MIITLRGEDMQATRCALACGLRAWMPAMMLLLLSGCAMDLPQGGNPAAVSRGGTTSTGQVQAQVVDVIDTVGIDQLHKLGLSGKGRVLFLLAPFKGYRSGMNMTVGFYLQQIVQAIAPAAQVITCDTGGDVFYLEPAQLDDCFLEALSLPQKPDVVVAGAMAWQTAGMSCEDLLNGRLASSGLLIFAGAGDFGLDELSYPACLKGVTPVAATYDADRYRDLPLLVKCWAAAIHKDELACFTNYLNDSPLLAAPGAVVDINLFGVDSAYCCSTAVSATVAAAVVALLKEAYPEASASQLLQALRQTGVPIRKNDGKIVGTRISAHRAYRWLEEHQSVEPPPQPRQAPSVRDFDRNQNCIIDEPEMIAAQDAWVRGEIEQDLFLAVLEAWINQTRVCESST